MIRARPSTYQLAFRTPGISPLSANLRKQIRQMPNLRYTARGRPHKRHRLCRRVENFGGRFALMIFALLAMEFSKRVFAVGLSAMSLQRSAYPIHVFGH
jgi:hypothetical protein